MLIKSQLFYGRYVLLSHFNDTFSLIIILIIPDNVRDKCKFFSFHFKHNKPLTLNLFSKSYFIFYSCVCVCTHYKIYYVL